MLLFLLSCTSSTSNYNANEQLTPDQQKALVASVIRYAAELPKKATIENRMDTAWNSHYAEQVEKHRLDFYYTNPGTKDTYLMISRLAPSLKVKRVGIGIHLRMEGDSIAYYKEVFRTWKMPEDVLAEKGGKLFALMVKGRDLSPYYPENSGAQEYIEFPDANTYYDVEKRKWISKLENPVEELLRQSEQGAQ